MSVSDFNDLFDLDIEVGKYDTLNGYLLTKLSKIPEEGARFELDNIDFKVSKVENRRIENIEINI